MIKKEKKLSFAQPEEKAHKLGLQIKLYMPGSQVA